MKTPAAIALALVASAISATVSWQLARNHHTADAIDESQKNPTRNASLASLPSGESDGTRENSGSHWLGSETTISKEERAARNTSIPSPPGIDPELWNQSLERAKGVAEWVRRAREEGRLEQRIKNSVEQDSRNIAQQVGLPEDKITRVAELLEKRQHQFYEKPKALFDAMTADQESLAELIAIRRMNREDGEISPQLEARKEELKAKMFNKVLNGATLSDDEFGNLFHGNRPDDWYKDASVVSGIASDLGEADGQALQIYAEKMTYLDREYGANRRLYEIERSLPITPGQREQLMHLYIQNRNPSDAELRRILPPEMVDQAREAANR